LIHIIAVTDNAPTDAEDRVMFVDLETTKKNRLRMGRKGMSWFIYESQTQEQGCEVRDTRTTIAKHQRRSKANTSNYL